MSRNLVVCCDGTNNEFGPENTNVIRLVQVLVQDPKSQIVFYDPGVGTMPEPGLFTRIGKTISTWFALALGLGILRNVEEAYTFLMQNWEPGDRVFLFGFSRGAYTVRVLAAMLHQLGLLPRDGHNMLPYAVKLFNGIRHEREHKAEPTVDSRETWPYWRLCNAFRQTFARPVPCSGGETDLERHRREQRRFPVHFLGVWDTVSSVGWAWEPATFPFTARNPSVHIARHAISIDERRWFFRQNRLFPPKGERKDLKEHWFPGVHADVGGGYPASDGGLWRIPFHWILCEASQNSLRVDSHLLWTVMSRPAASDSPWNDPQHESLTGAWWIAEFVPKTRSVKDSDRTGASPAMSGERCSSHDESDWLWPQIGCGRRRRSVQSGALIDQSTLLRIRETNYAPSNLSVRFLEEVRKLEHVPESLEYKP